MDFLVYVASGVLFAWGISHIIPTRSVVRGFGDITRDSRLTIVQTWVGEGVTLCFVAVVAALTVLVSPGSSLASAVRLSCAVLLFVFAVWHWFTGSRTPVVPMKICPFLLTSVGTAYVVSVFA